MTFLLLKKPFFSFSWFHKNPSFLLPKFGLSPTPSPLLPSPRKAKSIPSPRAIFGGILSPLWKKVGAHVWFQLRLVVSSDPYVGKGVTIKRSVGAGPGPFSQWHQPYCCNRCHYGNHHHSYKVRRLERANHKTICAQERVCTARSPRNWSRLKNTGWEGRELLD